MGADVRLVKHSSGFTPPALPASDRNAGYGRSHAYYIVAGTRIPHTRHFSNLAALVGVELPGKFAAALSGLERRS